jgi:hypothetical protein
MIIKLEEEFHKDPNVWKRIVVQVSDSTDKTFKSKKVRVEPSWSVKLKAVKQEV